MRGLHRGVIGAALVLVCAASATSVAPADAGEHPLSITSSAATPDPISGLYPADVAAAYGLAGGVDGGTVAVVVAYSNPALADDLATYRSEFGLPECTRANGCLSIVSQRGDADLPPATASGWAVEAALDVEAVSAACPGCRILVAEADSTSGADLGAAVNTAVSHGASAVSASFGGVENASSAAAQALYYTHPGVPIFAAAGDGGDAAALIPAALSSVIAVGGTTLTAADPGDPHVDGTWHFTADGGENAQAVVTADPTTTSAAPLTASTARVTAAKRAVTTATRMLAAAQRALARARRTHAKASTLARDARAVAAATVALRHARAVLAATERVTASPQPAPKPAPVTAPAPVAAPTPAPVATAAPVAPTPVATAASSGFTETAWADGESGCSARTARPTWQSGTGCAGRAVSDIAADADPRTGLAVYEGAVAGGWLVAGGTSLAAPLVAAMAVRSGRAAEVTPSWLYAHASGLRDIVSGRQSTCWGLSACTAGTGWDAPTGLGVPAGLTSF